MDDFKLQYRDLEMRVLRSLRELVETSTTESTQVAGNCLQINLNEYTEVALVHDKLTFIEPDGLEYSWSNSYCSLEDLIDIIVSIRKQREE